ncbi:MAG: hypothetical protein J6M43_02660 [Neisseriaceae bacterium]|nr:hypothetical protein [Neisseriaceae bacterium]
MAIEVPTYATLPKANIANAMRVQSYSKPIFFRLPEKNLPVQHGTFFNRYAS